MSKKNPATGTNEELFYENIKSMFTASNEVISDDKKIATKPVDELSKKWEMNEQIIELFADNIKHDQELKQKYAIILIIILIVELISLFIIFILKGNGILSYSDTTLNIFITGGIAEVFVLVKIIVQYLFKDNLTNALNIILENNNTLESKKNINKNNYDSSYDKKSEIEK